ncbi:hypothetical protein AQUCO_01100278v1 [Aquilegia coerulea]|uniref:Bromo domain-containing protein n=1 Tax=Aquilegia coerulea TaxID=218851 RepID=A0A2G5E6E5_AQUCA|nr:hypothetical protein AQUCO_01100278v1 [Aquilegia coerulea]
MERNSLLGYGGHKKSKKHSQKVLDPMTAKRQKSFKGHSSGFSSDYPHAMETMDDSEGLGSSGRIDTGLAASELYNVGRKSISLNDSKSGVFGVPLRVFSLPKLRRSERKELKLRLKAELEQVQVLSKKIAVRSTNGGAFSSASVIHSCSDGQKMPPNQSFQRSSQNLSVPTKKHGSSGQTNGASLKRDTSGRFGGMPQVTPVSTSHVMLMKQCGSLLQSLMSHQMGMGGIFNVPVDVVKFNIPDYFTVIKHPMDLGTVKKNLATGVYSSPFEFYADVKLTFTNAMTYNPPGNQVHNSAAKLKEYFELRWKSIEKKLLANKSKPVQSKSSAVGELEVAKAMPPAKKRKVSSIEHKVKPDIIKRVMTEEEKLKLTRDLEPLIADLPVHIANFLREHTFNATQTGDDEIEIDIEDLSDEVLLTLRKLVDDHLREIQRSQEKAEPCEMEVLNESGLSNSSMQPCKGNTIVDEDVDIGGNDPPVSSYPPVEIEKDGAHKKNKCTSSSSSSSDSGSSSSDSDSGSSSGSESHGAKVSSPAARIKETLGSDEVLDQKTSDLIDPNDGNPVSGLDQLEQTSQPRTGSTEADSCQDGEIAPSERQASPDKLYRAALLRNRFADTIFKAREKTLVQGEKGDPEKLRREREKLERQQREEKARLQAEARAAEDARRQAEAEYAVEAKRKRELEREAARQALLKMEKSVEINENRQFLEELEMLTVAPAENLPSSVDETSPIHSEDGMGGFKLQGCTNPLEQLGLYMKEEEEEEEEEVEHNTIQDPLTDVEEGEID